MSNDSIKIKNFKHLELKEIKPKENKKSKKLEIDEKIFDSKPSDMNIFLKLEPIDSWTSSANLAGDCTDIHHRGEIEVISFNLSQDNATKIKGFDGEEHAKKYLTLQTYYGTHSVGLVKCFQKGVPLKMVNLEICKPNDTSFDYIKVSKNFEQDKCWIHSYELNMNSGDKRPVEKFTLGFEKLWIWMRSRSKSGEYDGEYIRADVYFANFM